MEGLQCSRRCSLHYCTLYHSVAMGGVQCSRRCSLHYCTLYHSVAMGGVQCSRRCTLHYGTLYHSTLRHSVSLYTTALCITLHNGTLYHSTLLHSVSLCSAAEIVQCSRRCCAVLCKPGGRELSCFLVQVVVRGMAVVGFNAVGCEDDVGCCPMLLVVKTMWDVVQCCWLYRRCGMLSTAVGCEDDVGCCPMLLVVQTMWDVVHCCWL